MKPELKTLLTRYPGDTILPLIGVLFPKIKTARRRDCVFTLKTALEAAESYLPSFPTIPYVAARKAREIISQSGITSADFELLSEKEYLDRSLTLIESLHADSQTMVDDETKGLIDLALNAEEALKRERDALKVVHEVGDASPLGERIVAIYTGRHEAKKEEPKTPPLGKRLLQGLIVAIPGGVFGSLFGLTGVLAGAAGGYALGFFATNQGSDKPSEDEALSARAREAIKLLQDRAPHQLLQKLNVSVHELLSDPKAAATAHSDIWRLKGMFAAMTNEAAAHPV